LILIASAVHVADDRLVQVDAADAHRLSADDAIHGHHGRFGRAAAQIDDQVARRRAHRQPRADGRGQWFRDQVHLTRAGGQRRFAHGAPLDASDAIGHADHHRRLAHGPPPGNFGDEVLQHPLGDEVVGDNAVRGRPRR